MSEQNKIISDEIIATKWMDVENRERVARLVRYQNGYIDLVVENTSGGGALIAIAQTKLAKLNLAVGPEILRIEKLVYYRCEPLVTTPPCRAFSVEISAGGDTMSDLTDCLKEIITRLMNGETNPSFGNVGNGGYFTLKTNHEMTRDRYYEATGAWLESANKPK